MRARWLGWGVPLAVYVAYLSMASMVGRALPCLAGDRIYTWLGVLTLPVLLAAPVVFGLFHSRVLAALAGGLLAFVGWLVFMAGVGWIYVPRCVTASFH